MSTQQVREFAINDPNHPVAQDYAFFLHQQKHTSNIGSAQAPHYKPHELITNPPSPKDITLELLIASQTHIGHSTSLWNPANARYIFGIRGDADPIHIISPDATASHLRRACKVVSGVAERGGLILFVGTRQGQARAVVRAAQLSKGCHLFSKWIPGSITNGQQILGKCEKKVVNELDEPVEGFEDQLFAKSALKPDLVVCLNPLENYVLLHECGLNNIPTIGVIDTDANPTWVTYPIPANDDSLRGIQVIAGALGRAGEQGQKERLASAQRTGEVVYPAIHGLSAPAEKEETGRRGRQQPRQRVERQRARSQYRAARVAAEPTIQDEPKFPEDYENADVASVEKDNALLDEAEKVLNEQQGPDSLSSATSASVDTQSTPSAESLSGMEDSSPEEEEEEAEEEPSLLSDEEIHNAWNDYELDESLTNENFASSPPSSLSEVDKAQFGLHAAETTPIEQVEDVEKELNEEPEGHSPMEQTEGVVQELGEKAPEPDVSAGT